MYNPMNYSILAGFSVQNFRTGLSAVDLPAPSNTVSFFQILNYCSCCWSNKLINSEVDWLYKINGVKITHSLRFVE